MIDRVAVGQSFELKDEPGSLFTILEVKKGARQWHVTMLCLAGTGGWRQGRRSQVMTVDGTLSMTPFKRIG